jgi:diguanylate cyclase (GGDEF)-like protein
VTTPLNLAPATARRRNRSLAAQPAGDLSAPQDVLVFESMDTGFALVGGQGRGAGWAGIVQLGPADEALVGRSWRRGTAERISGRRPLPVAGPYYARHAVAVPVGQRHVVVFGAARPITLRDTELVRLAAAAVDATTHGVSADKLLADELELVHALRVLMAYRPVSVRDTVRHVATVAAQALSCEVAVMRVQLDGQTLVEGIDLRSMSALDNPDAGEFLASLDGRMGPLIEQVAPRDPDIFGVDVASRLTLPLPGPGAGVLALGHSADRARGFTSLCQRIGRAIADAAELLISQAHTREQLAAERDLLARLVRTDPLTGGANRKAWDDEVAAWRADGGRRDSAYVLYCDLDGLKAVNDQFGHAAGDALIRAAADLLKSCVRQSDMVARVGGDEFAVLLTPADAQTAGRVVGRVRRAQRTWRVTEHGLIPQLSVGQGAVDDGDLESARSAADRHMYQDKMHRSARQLRARLRGARDRRRRRAAGPTPPPRIE